MSSKASLHRKRKSLPANAFASASSHHPPHHHQQQSIGRSSSSRSVTPHSMSARDENVGRSASPKFAGVEGDPQGKATETVSQRTIRLFRHLWEKLKKEVTYDTGNSGASALKDTELDQIVSFLLIPFSLEKVMFFGFLTCLDSFLYSFTVLPLRFLVVLATQLRFFLRRKRGSLPISQKIDLIKSVVLLMTVYLLSSLNASILYHNIRGQSAVKLYVMFNVLEIGDKLFCSFGQDVLAVLLSSRTLNGAIWKMYLFGTIAVCYNLLHSAALFCQMITLNVAVNSYSNALLTLLLSNQFGEIKSTVFKKFERENLFQLTCADIAERFQLWTMLLMIGLRNIVEVSGSTGGVIPQSWKGWNTFMGALFGPAVVVLGSEIAVDWLKHSYIAKFNKLRPKVYSRFLTVFCVDQVNNADIKSTNKTWGRKEMNVTRRIGVPILPLTCVFIKSTVQVMQLVASTRPLSLPTRTTTHSPSVMGGEANNTAASMLPGSLLDMVSKSVGSTIEIGAYTGMLLLLFSALVFVKLVLGAVLLEYSKRRLEKQQQKESKTPTTQLSSETDPFPDERVSGERKGGVWGLVDLSDGLRELVSEHDEDDSVPSTPISPVSAVPSAASSIYEGHTTNQKKHVSLQEVERFQMVAKRIW